MKVLILQHENSTPAGSTLEWCAKNQYPCQVIFPSQVLTWPRPEDYDLLVVCGGGMNVDEEEKYPWLKAEKSFISEALKKSKKVVGLCLGAQLLAEVLGASVKKHSSWEVGWHPVKLLGGQELTVFQWHGYSFSLPPGAELTASNSICQNQGFAIGKQVLAYQFHPETTREWAIECAEHPQLPTTGFVQTGDEIKRGLVHQPALQAWYFSQLDSLVVDSAK